MLFQKTIDMRKMNRDISSYQAMMDYIETMIEREEAKKKDDDSSEES